MAISHKCSLSSISTTGNIPRLTEKGNGMHGLDIGTSWTTYLTRYPKTSQSIRRRRQDSQRRQQCVSSSRDTHFHPCGCCLWALRALCWVHPTVKDFVVESMLWIAGLIFGSLAGLFCTDCVDARRRACCILMFNACHGRGSVGSNPCRRLHWDLGAVLAGAVEGTGSGVAASRVRWSVAVGGSRRGWGRV